MQLIFIANILTDKSQNYEKHCYTSKYIVPNQHIQEGFDLI